MFNGSSYYLPRPALEPSTSLSSSWPCHSEGIALIFPHLMSLQDNWRSRQGHKTEIPSNMDILLDSNMDLQPPFSHMTAVIRPHPFVYNAELLLLIVSHLNLICVTRWECSVVCFKLFSAGFYFYFFSFHPSATS